MKCKNMILSVGVTFMFCFTLMSCTKTQVIPKPPVVTPPNPCEIPQDNRLDIVIEKTKKALKSNKCDEEFDTFYENILAVGEGNRDMKNKKIIEDFLVWCINNGTLNKNTGERYYASYFSYKFVSTNDFYNISSQCNKDKIESVFRKIENELHKKDRGLNRICGDKESYAKAYQLQKELKLVLTATCEASGAH